VWYYITFNLKDGISDVHVLSLASKSSTSLKRWKLFCLLDTVHNTYDSKKRNLTVFQKNNSEKQWVRFGSTQKNTKIFGINLRSHFICGMKEDGHRTKQNILYQFTYVANKKDISIQPLLHKSSVYVFFVSSESETDSMLSLHNCNNPDVISFLKRRKASPRE
jgi:hypothetical protein